MNKEPNINIGNPQVMPILKSLEIAGSYSWNMERTLSVRSMMKQVEYQTGRKFKSRVDIEKKSITVTRIM